MSSGSALEEFAQRVSAFLRERYGVEVPVVWAPARGEGPHLWLDDTAEWYGDPYSGYWKTCSAELAGFVPPGSAEPLSVKMDYTVHDLSGQTDSWSASVTGAPEADHEAWRALFALRGWPVSLGASARPGLYFDGKPDKKP